MRIAYLEDDMDQANLLMAWLTESGHHYHHYNSGNEFVSRIYKDSYDCIILDWEIPDLSGIEVLSWIRKHYDSQVPILFLTQRDDEHDIVKALESGADDYLIKPVRQAEFFARLKALYRRSSNTFDPETFDVEITPYEIDVKNEKVLLNDKQITLTKKEYDLVLFLFRNIGKIVSRDHIMGSVWANYSGLNTRTVDTHISRIRSKLKIGVDNNWKLNSIYMHGYRLDKIE